MSIPETQEPTTTEVLSSLNNNEGEAESREALVIKGIFHAIHFIEKAVATVETRYITRALKGVPSLRKDLDVSTLTTVIKRVFPEESERAAQWMELIGSDEQDKIEIQRGAPTSILPEVELYVGLLIQIYLLDKDFQDKCINVSEELVKYIQEINRRTADKLAARIYFYYSFIHELRGDLSKIRPILLKVQRSASLRRDDETQATILNILIRSYFESNLYDQADKLVSKTTFPENVSNNQYVRYMYLLGRIKALQLDYTSAHQHLLQAVRKAPQNAQAAGFLQNVHKLHLIVQLLLGDLPDRAVFRIPMLRGALQPYLEITQAVRVGDLTKFQNTLARYSDIFQRDRNYNLIVRLRHKVIKTGIRMISLAYKRISLRDICLKLQLDSEQDAEYIVAKAIRDGVIDAVINHEEGFIQSKENVDVYSTNEPMDAFHQRISFCLNLHNDSVKALRFPKNFQHPELEFAEEVRERERELAKEFENDLSGDEGDMEF